jgi:hypothetical protein
MEKDSVAAKAAMGDNSKVPHGTTVLESEIIIMSARCCVFFGLPEHEVVSEALAYSGVAFTVNGCSHIIEAVRQDAMMLPDGIARKGKRWGVCGKTKPNWRLH